MPNIIRAASIAAGFATLAYCWAIWWFAGLFAVMSPHNHGAYETTMISVVLLAPIPGTFWLQAIHWQVLAIASLLIALKFTRGVDHSASETGFTATPLLTHGFCVSN